MPSAIYVVLGERRCLLGAVLFSFRVVVVQKQLLLHWMQILLPLERERLVVWVRWYGVDEDAKRPC